MALKFYLGEKDNSHIINVETNASFIENIANFDTGSFTMEWNLTEKAIAPFTKFFIEDTTLHDTWCFVIVSDEVEVVKKISPVKYLHHLLIKQNTYSLTKNIIRNSVFTQPIDKDTVSYFSISGSVQLNRTSYTTATWKDGLFHWNSIYENEVGVGKPIIPSGYLNTISLAKKEKVSSAYISLETWMLLFRKTVLISNFQDPDNWIKNNHNNIYLKITKNKGGVFSYLYIPFENGKTKYEIPESDLSFFNDNGASFSLDINKNENSTFKPIDISGEFDFDDYHSLAGNNLIITNIKAELHLRSYYYSLYDVLDILAKQCQKIYNGTSLETPYVMPTDTESEVYKTLKETVAPNFNFSSKDLYSCVREVLSYIDAIATIDENKVLGFVYLNDHNRQKANILIADKKISLTEQNFANSITANYQNGRQEESIFYPAKNVFARVGSSNYGIPQSNDYSFNVAKPIDYIDSAKIIYEDLVSTKVMNFEAGAEAILIYNQFPLPNKTLDISQAIFENTIYSLLDMADGGTVKHNQQNSLSFVQGDTKISVGNIVDGFGNTKSDVYVSVIYKCLMIQFGHIADTYTISAGTVVSDFIVIESINFPTKKDLKYNIEYHAVFDGRVNQESTVNKVDGEIYINQSNANVSLNRMGNNMQGLIAKLGNEVKNFTLPITSYGSRLKIGSMWVDDDGNKYVANAIKTTFSTSSQKVFVECEFTKDFNMLSQFTQIDQERRFYEINEKLTSKGYENITEFIYFTTKPISAESNTPSCLSAECFNKIIETLSSGEEENNYRADFTYIATYESIDDVLAATRYIYCPLHTYGFGNSICFEMGYDDPLNAGNRLTGNATIGSPLMNKTTLYVAENGFADKINVSCVSYYGDEFYAGEEFPNIRPILETRNTKNMFSITEFEYYKKPNEIFHLNYSVSFMPFFSGNKYEEIYFGDEFINGNLIINGNLKKDKLYIFISNDEQYSIIDNVALGNMFDEIETTFDITSYNRNHYGSITFTPKNRHETFNCKSWAIADENGNILIAVNQTLNSVANTTVNVFTSRYRKN